MAGFPPGDSDPNKYGTAFSFSQPEGSSISGPANYSNTAFTSPPMSGQLYGFNYQTTTGQPSTSFGLNALPMPGQPHPSYEQATQHMPRQPPPSYDQATQPGEAQTINIQIDPNTAAVMQGIMTMVDSNNPATNENPVQMKCPSCQQEITTSTEYVTGSCTYLACIMCFFVGCILLCWLPFIVTSSKDVIHTCPSCEAECGRFVRQNQRRIGVGGTGVHHGGYARRARARRAQARRARAKRSQAKRAKARRRKRRRRR